MSDKSYSEAVIGQFKTLFRKRTNIPQLSTTVTKAYPWSDRILPHLAIPQRPVELNMNLSQPNY